MVTAYFRKLSSIIVRWRKVEPPDPVPDRFLDSDQADHDQLEQKQIKKKENNNKLTNKKNRILSIWV